MNAHVKPTRIATLLFALVLASVAGCGHDIGDECRTSADCDPNGTRACDLSQPGGYCTVAGCDESSCPEDSACLRTFPQQYISTETCDPNAVKTVCTTDEVCLNFGDPDPNMGQCVRRSFEQRTCVKTCSGNDDCRGGYVCRATNAPGSMLLSRDPRAMAKFCAPTPQ
jgi:hypothetical protein